jgi:subtilisin inhibitor-like
LGPLVGAAALVVALLTASCGEGEGAEEPAAPPETSIEVTLWPNGSDAGEKSSAVLTCDPPGGSHPSPEEACAALDAQEDALAPVPGDVACTQIFGGPQEAHVAGVVRGHAIDARFSRSNGCEIDRWDRLAALLKVIPSA